jgi:hypothetical protein
VRKTIEGNNGSTFASLRFDMLAPSTNPMTFSALGSGTLANLCANDITFTIMPVSVSNLLYYSQCSLTVNGNLTGLMTFGVGSGFLPRERLLDSITLAY